MPVHYETDGPIAIVTIDRPEVRNAVDDETAEALAAAFRHFDADDSLAVAILTGALRWRGRQASATRGG